MESFGCDSYLRIDDITEFGLRIARHIPGLVGGAEGPCLYMQTKVIEKDLGYIDLSRFKAPDGDKVDQGRVSGFINEQMGHLPFFLKHRNFSNQSEYRLLWFTAASIADYIDVQVPEARDVCSTELLSP
jgi:hypothetical protein